MVAFSKLGVAIVAGVVAAHSKLSPLQMKREIIAREHAASLGARSLAGCSSLPSHRALKQRSIRRRAEKVKSIREKKGIKSPSRKDRRTLAELEAWEAAEHNMTGTYDWNMFSPLTEVFDANTSCILAPEVTDGPYYVIGEFMRSNVKEAQYSDGVDLFLEVQYVDINTCEPIPDVAIDIWNANATGVYSGIYTSGNYAANGLNSTYLRGIQLTDHDGVVSFETIFPGHYEGRATHTHLLAHTNATLESNGTISVREAAVAHIGQLFYPEDLRSAVEAVYPYTTNTQAVTSNDDDMWSIVQADSSYDPFPKYLYLGDSIEDGLFAWMQIGVNASADYSDDDYYSIAAYLDADGGHDSGSTVVGGSGGAGGNGTASSGVAIASTAAPSASIS